MTVSLTTAEANKILSDITEKKDHAVQTLSRIADAQDEMLAQHWAGASASKYHLTSTSHRDEFNQIINQLTHVVATATTHIGNITSSDEG